MQKFIYCKKYYAAALSENLPDEKQPTRALTRIRCKAWSCEYCAAMNRKAWRRAIIEQVAALGGSWSFWTITMNGWVTTHTEDESERARVSAAIIRHNFDTLMKRLKRWLGAFQYLRVIERHKSGTLHLHLLLNVHVPDNRKATRRKGKGYFWTSDIAKAHIVACNFGKIHDVRNLHDATYVKGDADLRTASALNVAVYVTKYMTKDNEDSALALSTYRLRKIQTSRGILSPSTIRKRDREDKARIVWTVRRSGFDLTEVLSPAYVVRDVQKQKFIQKEDFQGGMMYPPLIERKADAKPAQNDDII